MAKNPHKFYAAITGLQNQTTAILDLDDEALTTDDLAALKQALENNISLKKLSLRNNALRVAAITAVLDVLATKHHPITVDLSGNKIVPQEIPRLYSNNVTIYYPDSAMQDLPSGKEYDFGKDGKLFAQIHADSDLHKTPFEGNIIENVFEQMNLLLQHIPDYPLNYYITNPIYTSSSTSRIYADTAKKLYLQQAQGQGQEDLIATLTQNGVLVYPCSLDGHAIIMEFKLENERLIVNVYNTGHGLDNHEQRLAHGVRRFACCKSHRINLSYIPADQRPQYVKNIISLVTPDGFAKKYMQHDINVLYRQLERMCRAYPDSRIDNNNSTFIIGQRSGSCVWKSMFRFVCEHVQEISNNQELDLLVKYDIKLRTLLALKEQLKDPKKIMITNELMRVIMFACENNTRLAQKLHGKRLITDHNLQASLQLFTEMRSLGPALQQRVTLDDGMKDIMLGARYPIMHRPAMVAPSVTDLRPLSVQQAVKNDFQANDASSCISSIFKLSDQIRRKELNDSKYIVTATQHLMQVSEDYLLAESHSSEDGLKLLQAIQLIVYKYLSIAQEDAKKGFGEIRSLTMCRAQLIALHITSATIDIAHINHWLSPLHNLEYARVIVDPSLMHEFMRTSTRYAELMAKLKPVTTADPNGMYFYKLENTFTKYLQTLWSEQAEDDTVKLEILFMFMHITVQTNAISLIEIERPKTADTSLLRTSSGIIIEDLNTLIACLKKNDVITCVGIELLRALRPSPIDKFVLPTAIVEAVYSKGMIPLLNHYSGSTLRAYAISDTSNLAYMPRARNIKFTDACLNMLQSMFAEQGIGLTRLKEFIVDNVLEFNDQKYIDLVIMLLFTNDPISKQLFIRPQNVLEFIESLKAIVATEYDAPTSLSSRARFPIQIFYLSAWYILGMQDQCSDVAVFQQIEHSILNTNYLPYVQSKLNVLEKANRKDESIYTELLLYKILHYQVYQKLHGSLDDEQLLDIVCTNIRLQLKLLQDSPLLDITTAFLRETIISLNPKFIQSNSQQIINALVAVLGHQITIIKNVSYEPGDKILGFNINNIPVTYNFASGNIIFGHETLSLVPKEFKEHDLFKKMFKPMPNFCLVKSEARIEFEYRDNKYTAFFKDSVLRIMQNDRQLYLPEPASPYRAVRNVYSSHALPSPILDNNHVVFLTKEGPDVIANAATHQDMYRIDWNKHYDVTRIADGAKLITAQDLIAQAFTRFENIMYIEAWQLVDGGIELNLQRYNLIIRYNPKNPKLIEILKPHSAHYEFCINIDFLGQFPNGILFKNSAGELVALLPQQFYIPKPIAGNVPASFPAIIFDNCGIVWHEIESRKTSTYLENIKNPQYWNYMNSQQFAMFKYSPNEIQCQTAEEYFYLAYYLLGQNQYHMTKYCLYKGFILSGSSVSASQWLANIIIFLPREKTAGFDNYTPKYGQFNSKQVGLRVLAFYMLLKQFSAKELVTSEMDNLLAKGHDLLNKYYGNLGNIPNEYKLSNTQELELLSIIVAFYASTSEDVDNLVTADLAKSPIIEDRYNWILAKVNNQPTYLQKKVTSGFVHQPGNLEVTLSPNVLQEPMIGLGYLSANQLAQVEREVQSLLFDDKNISNILSEKFLYFIYTIANNPANSPIIMQIKCYVLSGIRCQAALWLLYIIKQCEIDSEYNAFLLQSFNQVVNKYGAATLILQLLVDREQKGVMPNEVHFKLSFTDIQRATKKDIVIYGAPYTADSIQVAEQHPIDCDLQKIYAKYSLPPMLETQQDVSALPLAPALEPEWLQIPDSTQNRMLRRQVADYRFGVLRNIVDRTALDERSRSTTPLTESELNFLTQQITDLETKIIALFNVTNTHIEQATRLSGSKPELNLQEILRIFIQQDKEFYKNNSFMSDAECSEINGLIYEYLFAITQLQEHERGNKQPYRAYTANDDPRLVAICLLFEMHENIRIFPMQVENIKHMLEKGHKANAIVQMAMGQGKTKIMAPIIAAANADGTHIAVYVVPEPLFDTTVNAIRLTTYNIFGKCPVPIKFERNDLSYHALNKILAQMQAAQIERNFIIMSPATLHALYLTRRECALRINEDRTEKEKCLEALAEIFHLLAEYGICTIDEIDQVLDVQIDYNYASVDFQNIDKKFPGIINTMMDFYALLADVPLPESYDSNLNILDIVLGKARKPLEHEWLGLRKAIAERVAEIMFNNLGLEHDLIVQCLEGLQDIDTIGSGITTETKNRLGLMKYQIADLFRITIESSNLEQFGPKVASQNTFDDVVAIPHRQQVPIIGSEFSDQLTTINFTIQSFLNVNTAVLPGILISFFEILKRQFVVSDVDKKYDVDKNKELKNFICNLLRLAPDEFKIALLNDQDFINRITLESYDNIPLKTYLLKYFVLGNITESDYELQSRAFTFNAVFKKVCGFSGTLENIKIFDPSMHFANEYQSIGTDGAVIDLLVSSSPFVSVADQNQKPEDQLRDLLARNAQEGKNLHALIDTGAAFKEISDNKSIAKIIADYFVVDEKYKHINYILFFAKNTLSALDVNALRYTGKIKIKTIADPSHAGIDAACGSPDNYFTFYDQAHSIGIDIRQSGNAHAIITIGENILKRDFLQGCKRMRGFKIGGEQTLEIFVSNTARNKCPDLEAWDLNAVLSFILRNSLKIALDLNFRTAQLLMEQYLINKITNIAIDRQWAAKIYADVLTVVQDPSLYARYGAFASVLLVEDALKIYRDQLLIVADRHMLDTGGVIEYCNSIINSFVSECAEQVSSTLSTAKVKGASFVAKENKQQDTQRDKEQDENKMELENVALLHPLYTISYSEKYLSLSAFLQGHSFRHAFSDHFGKYCTIPLFPFAADELDKQILCGKTTLLDFYTATNASKQMQDVQKNAYYLLECVEEYAVPYYILLNEESKELLLNSISGYKQFKSAQARWTPVKGQELFIYDKKGNLQYPSTVNDRKLKSAIKMRMYFFNADVTQLMEMLNGDDTQVVQEYFANDPRHKFMYLRNKVAISRPDQKMALQEFAGKIGFDWISSAISTKDALDADMLPLLQSFSRMARNSMPAEGADPSTDILHGFKANLSKFNIFQNFSPVYGYPNWYVQKEAQSRQLHLTQFRALSLDLVLGKQRHYIMEHLYDAKLTEQAKQLLAPEIYHAAQETILYLSLAPEAKPKIKPAGLLPESMHEELLSNAQDLLSYSQNIEVYKKYLEDYYYRGNKPYVLRSYIFSDKATSFLDLLAYIYHMKLHIHSPNGDIYTTADYRTPEILESPELSRANEKHIGFNGEYFIELRRNASRPSPS